MPIGAYETARAARWRGDSRASGSISARGINSRLPAKEGSMGRPSRANTDSGSSSSAGISWPRAGHDHGGIVDLPAPSRQHGRDQTFRRRIRELRQAFHGEAGAHPIGMQEEQPLAFERDHERAHG